MKSDIIQLQDAAAEAKKLAEQASAAALRAAKANLYDATTRPHADLTASHAERAIGYANDANNCAIDVLNLGQNYKAESSDKEKASRLSLAAEKLRNCRAYALAAESAANSAAN